MRQLVIGRSITNRESLSLEKYLRDVNKLSLISSEEEVKLVRRIRQGDQLAMDQLVKANLRFVVSVAKKYQGQGLPLSDLINEGNIGLIEAARKFDETKGFKFISYAVWWIRQSILIAISEHSRLIRLPMNKLAKSRQIQKTFVLLEQKFERTPTSEELSEMLEMEAEEIDSLALAMTRTDSLDSSLGENDDDGTMLDVIENPNAQRANHHLEQHESFQQQIHLLMKVLSKKQKQVICYFFGIGIEEPMSLEAIAAELYVTPERVRQIKEKAISLLRAEKGCGLLKDFL